MASAENVLQMRHGMEKNALVSLDTIKSMVLAELVIPIVPIMAETVSATMDSSEMPINVSLAILVVENAKGLKKTNASHALMSAMILSKANASETHLVQLDYS